MRDGKIGRIMPNGSPGEARPNRGRAWNNVISVAFDRSRVIATDKETGKIVWEKKPA